MHFGNFRGKYIHVTKLHFAGLNYAPDSLCYAQLGFLAYITQLWFGYIWNSASVRIITDTC